MNPFHVNMEFMGYGNLRYLGKFHTIEVYLRIVSNLILPLIYRLVTVQKDIIHRNSKWRLLRWQINN